MKEQTELHRLLGLSRAYGLHQMLEITTLAETAKYTDEELLKCRNIGKMAVIKIRRLQAEKENPKPKIDPAIRRETALKIYCALLSNQEHIFNGGNTGPEY